MAQNFAKSSSGGTASPLTTKGDIWTFSTVDDRLAVGSDGQILQALASASTGIAWSTPTYPSTSGTAGKFLRSDGTNNVYSTSTIPTSAGATANKVLLSDGTNYVLSTPTFPNASATSGKIIVSDGTNWIASTPTFPNASATAGKFIRSDGTNWIASTPTLPTSAGTSGKVLVSDGTNYIESTPTFPNASATSGKFIRSDGTNWIASTPTLPTSAGTSGKVLVSDGTNYIESTPTFPNASATSGKVIKSDGTNWVASTETYAAPGTSGNILTSDGTNWTSAAPTGGGVVVQQVRTITGAVATGSTTLPIDDTIPQNTEGDQYMSLAITPTNTNHVLLIEVKANWSRATTANGSVIALFQDSTANALAVVAKADGATTTQGSAILRYYMTAGTTSATTFKARIGNGAGNTITFNGQSAARLFGGVYDSTIIITEYTA